MYRTGAYPISPKPLGFVRNPYLIDRGIVSVDLRVSKGFVLPNDRGLLSVGISGYNLTNHTNPLRVALTTATVCACSQVTVGLSKACLDGNFSSR
jgi:hypothetical protein